METKDKKGRTDRLKNVLIAIGFLSAITIVSINNYYGTDVLLVKKEDEKIRHLSTANFNSEIKSGLVLVDFWAPWCGPCRAMAPILNDVANEMGSDVKICKLNIDENRNVAQDYSIEGIPTMILFKNGKEIKRVVGIQSRESLIDQIKKQK